MTFYRLPRETAVANWVRESPEGFLFAVKMSRYVTHIKRLRDLPPSLELSTRASSRSSAHRSSGRCPGSFRGPSTRRRAACRGAGAAPAGPALLRVPPRELVRARAVRAAAGARRRARDRRHPRAAVPGARVDRGLDVRPLPPRHARPLLNYSRAEIEEWAPRLAGWAETGDVYVYFNNDWNGYAVRNAAYLTEAARRSAVRPLLGSEPDGAFSRRHPEGARSRSSTPS